MNLQAELQDIVTRGNILILDEKKWIPDKLKAFFKFLPENNKKQLIDKRVKLTNHDTILTLSGLKCDLAMRGINSTALSLTQMIFSFTEQDNKIDVQIQVEGSITISSTSLFNVVGNLDSDVQFNFTPDTSSTSNFSLKEILNFIECEQEILAEIGFQDLQISTLKFNFGFNNAAPGISIECQKENSLTIIQDFANVETIKIILYYFYEVSGKRKIYDGDIRGQIKLGEEYIQVRLPVFFSYNWFIEFIPEGKQLPGLSTFIGYLPGGKILQQSVGQGFQQVNFKSVGLDMVNISFDIKKKRLENVDFQGHVFFKHKNLELKFQANISLPNFSIDGELPPDAPIKLKQLFETYFPTDNIGFPDINITELELSADPSVGQYDLSAAIVINQSQIMSTAILKLQLKQIEFQISKIYSSVYGSLSCVFELYGFEFTASASRLESNTGWLFDAYLSDNQGIDFKKLNELLKNFKLVLPTSLLGIKIYQLKLLFSTANKNFKFIGFGSLSLLQSSGQTSTDDKTASLQLDIDVKQESKSWSANFAGNLMILGRNFDLVFDANNQSKTFIADYHNANGDKLEIKDLVAYVSSELADKVPKSLEFTLKDAILAYQSESTSKYLFGIDIEGGLNLSDIKIPKLPLIGGSFPPDQTLKLAFHITAAGGKFTVEDIAKLNSLNSQALSLPQQAITPGLDLTALLRLGQDTKPLSLSISLNPQAKDGNGLVPQPASSKASATPAPPPPKTSATPTTNQTGANTISNDGVQWVKIQKNFGPAHIERVGIKYQDSKIDALLDASLTAAGLTLSLDGLSVSSKISPLQPEFSIHGLSIDYKSGPVEIGGAFLMQELTKKEEGKEDIHYTAFAGLAVIRAKVIGISAIGSYTQYKEHPSLFVYAVLNIPIPIDPSFVITGFAGGFGYNRRLIAPSIDQVNTFPLVEEAVKGDGGENKLDNLDTELKNLEKYIQPSVGQIFFAIGIKFTTYKLIDSFALLILQFGQRFEIDILGLSTVLLPPQLPSPTKSVEPLAEVQLALKATFVLDEGVVSFEAQLTSNSYILSRSCHLTGGFAFFCWFKDNDLGAKAGDLVVSLGGYHPKYIVPKHYPTVPRLGMNWQVSTPQDNYELSIKGGAYFAVTSQALMAGGCLEANWSSGQFKAWFKVSADFIISWQPYYYDANFYASLGVSCTFTFLGTQTINAELGANIHLWGPDFTGIATIDLKIISFDVKFGEASLKKEPIDWEKFKSSFLPKDDQICSITVQKGLVRQIKEEGKPERWIVNPKELEFATNSAIPIKFLNWKSEDKAVENDSPNKPQPNTDWGIVPMGIESEQLKSKHTIKIESNGQDKSIESKSQDKSESFKLTPILKTVPAGLWGKPNLTTDGKLNPPQLNGEQFVENTVAGFAIAANVQPTPGRTQGIEPSDLQYATQTIPGAYYWEKFDPLNQTDFQGEAALQEAAKDPTNNPNRTKLLSALGFTNYNIDFGQPIDQGVAKH